MLNCSQNRVKFESIFDFAELSKVPDELGSQTGNPLQDFDANEFDQRSDDIDIPKFIPPPTGLTGRLMTDF